MQHPAAVLLGCITAATCLSGCSSASEEPTPVPVRTVEVGRIESNGRTLLTLRGGNGDQTDFGGRLGEDSARCITVGSRPVIVPDTAQLLPDGSVVLDGRRWRPGTEVRISGSGWAEPTAGLPCGEGVYWYSGSSWSAR